MFCLESNESNGLLYALLQSTAVLLTDNDNQGCYEVLCLVLPSVLKRHFIFI